MDLAAIFTIQAMCVSGCILSSIIPPTLTVFPRVLLKPKPTFVENWILNVIGFFAIFLFSLTGATGLVVHVADGNGFCEEFNTIIRGRCAGARSVIGVSWATVVIGELPYLSQFISADIAIGPFSYHRGPGFFVGQRPQSRSKEQTRRPIATHSYFLPHNLICSFTATGPAQHTAHSSLDPPKALVASSIERDPFVSLPREPDGPGSLALYRKVEPVG